MTLAKPTAKALTWEPYRTQPFTSPAGQSCAFPLKGEPVHDEEQIATLATFPDGTPKQQVIKGDLRVRYTNLDTGAAVEKDLNGVGYLEYETTGASTTRSPKRSASRAPTSARGSRSCSPGSWCTSRTNSAIVATSSRRSRTPGK